MRNLTGSEKQVSWANDIINKFYQDLESKRNFWEDTQKVQTGVSYEEIINNVNNYVEEHKEAKFWIDTRNNRQNIATIMWHIAESIQKNRK